MAYFSRSPECTTGGINAVFEKKKQRAQEKILEAEDTEKPGHDTGEDVGVTVTKNKQEKYSSLKLNGYNLTEEELINEYQLQLMTHLTELDLTNNSLTELPQALKNLTEIETLRLSWNKRLFKNIPSEDEEDGDERKWIAELPKLQTVQMRHNDLIRWPTFLDSASALTALDLSHNLICFGDASPENTPSSITEFVSTLIFGRQSTPQQQGPPQLDKIMPSLTYLDLSDNRIVTFPIDILKQIPTLLKLKLKKNEISQQTTDNAMDGVFELILLDLSNCNISTLYIPRLPKLQTLILDNNTSLSIIGQDMIDRFNNLVELCISETGIDYPQLERLMDHLPLLQKLCANKTRIAGTITLRSPQLRVLELSNNRITRVLVDGDQQDFQMSALNLSNNQIEYIDDRVSHFTELTTLNLSNNHLDTCPNVGSMRHLVDLRLDNNRIHTITSEQLQDCGKLRKLTMSHNRLVHVPDRIALLSELEELDLSHNKIRDYALVTASQLTCLETLNLEYNYLSSVVQNDCDISTLVSLQVLQIAHNEITSLPNGIYVLQNLKMLTMDQNGQSLYNAASADANFLRWQDRYLVKVECSLHIPSQISETLYLSSEMAASNRLLLSQLGITHILTIGDKTLSRHLDDDTEEFTCMKLPLANNNSAQVQPLLDRAFRFIDQARQQGGACLVHGFAGHNRSATIVIAYLMSTELLTYDQALERVTSVRENVRVSPHFVKQLQNWEKERK